MVLSDVLLSVVDVLDDALAASVPELASPAPQPLKANRTTSRLHAIHFFVCICNFMLQFYLGSKGQKVHKRAIFTFASVVYIALLVKLTRSSSPM